jgi:cytochrome c biogenesis protein CcmG/thiol:disulfide interchange protein DsbE
MSGTRGLSASPRRSSAVCFAVREPNIRIVIKELARATGKLAICLAAGALAALVAAGCGSSAGGDYGGQHPDYAKALAGSPPPLATLHKQANELLPGGVEAYEARLAALRGYPVVANVWASWCGPCRFEFPSLQKMSAAYGKRVAFIGVDKQDSDAAAKTFLGEAPLSYPSYTDPDSKIAESLGGAGGVPDTAFYDRSGKLLYLKQGPYSSHDELRADIQRYALDEGAQSG